MCKIEKKIKLTALRQGLLTKFGNIRTHSPLCKNKRFLIVKQVKV